MGLHKVKCLDMLYSRRRRQGIEAFQDFSPMLEYAAGQFADNEGMAEYVVVFK
jgi:hypothetical protein